MEVSVFATKPIILHGVKLKESAFRDFDLPLRYFFAFCSKPVHGAIEWLRCKYGKIETLSIDIPWTSVLSKPTKVVVKVIV